MAENTGTKIGAPIVQPTTEDAQNYVTHYAKLGKGGFFSVASIAERNALPDVSREVGMVVSVVADGNWYELIGGIDNSNWQVVEFGGGNQDLQDVLNTGNEALNVPIILNGALYSNRVYNNGFRVTKLNTEFYTNLNFVEPTLNGNIQFPAPLDTEVHTLPFQFSVNGGAAVEANENGVVNLSYIDESTLKNVIHQNPLANGLTENIVIETDGTFTVYGGGGVQIGDGGVGNGTVFTTGSNAAKYQNDVTAQILSDNDIPNKKYVDDAVAGGGTGNAEMLTKTDGGLTQTLQFQTPFNESANFLLPATTTPDDKVLVTHVNQVPANDGGVVFLDAESVFTQNPIVNLYGAGAAIYSQSEDFSSGGNFEVFPEEVNLGSSGISGSSILHIDPTQIQFASSEILFAGVGIYEIDYSGAMTSDRHIPDIGKVNDLIAAAGSGGVTEVLGTTNEITVTGTETQPVVGINSNYTAARNAYADAKVENNLTASTTVAPSKTAVNTALAGKGNLSGGNTWSGTQVFSPGTIQITGANGIPFYTAGNESWITGTNNQFIAANGEVLDFALKAQTSSIGIIVPTNSALSNGISFNTAMRRIQGQINAVNDLVITNDTTTAFTKSTLNSTYSTAAAGTRIICKNVGSGMIYTKASGTDWLSSSQMLMP